MKFHEAKKQNNPQIYVRANAKEINISQTTFVEQHQKEAKDKLEAVLKNPLHFCPHLMPGNNPHLSSVNKTAGSQSQPTSGGTSIFGSPSTPAPSSAGGLSLRGFENLSRPSTTSTSTSTPTPTPTTTTTTTTPSATSTTTTSTASASSASSAPVTPSKPPLESLDLDQLVQAFASTKKPDENPQPTKPDIDKFLVPKFDMANLPTVTRIVYLS